MDDLRGCDLLRLNRLDRTAESVIIESHFDTGLHLSFTQPRLQVLLVGRIENQLAGDPADLDIARLLLGRLAWLRLNTAALQIRERLRASSHRRQRPGLTAWHDPPPDT